MPTVKLKWVTQFTAVTAVVIITLSKIARDTEDDAEEIRYRIRGPLSWNDTTLVTLVRESYLHPPDNEPYNLSNGNDPLYVKYAKEDTWYNIHLYLQNLFANESLGFFVEAGALDGEFLSNTLWLEQSLGWTGLLVEPDKESFHQLQSKHRRAWTSNTCLSSQPFPKETIHVEERLRGDRYEYGVSWNHRGSSHELGVNIGSENTTFFKLTESTYSVVQCFPLGTLLKAIGISTVDFLSLDTQGTEKHILKNIPWDTVRIRVIVAEMFGEILDYDFMRYMESKGYVIAHKKFAALSQDHIYVREDEKYLLENLSRFVVL